MKSDLHLAPAIFPASHAVDNSGISAADARALSDACMALWSATLSLMTAYMHNRAPAHRILLARRISSNLHTLHEQECFTAACRDTFKHLGERWKKNADALAVQEPPFRNGHGRTGRQARWMRL